MAGGGGEPGLPGTGSARPTAAPRGRKGPPSLPRALIALSDLTGSPCMCSQHRPRSKSGPSSLPRLCFPLPILLLFATCCALGMDAPMLCTASAPQLLVHRVQPHSQLPPAALGGPARGTTNTASSSRSPQCLLPTVLGSGQSPPGVEGHPESHSSPTDCPLSSGTPLSLFDGIWPQGTHIAHPQHPSSTKLAASKAERPHKHCPEQC